MNTRTLIWTFAISLLSLPICAQELVIDSFNDKGTFVQSTYSTAPYNYTQWIEPPVDPNYVRVVRLRSTYQPEDIFGSYREITTGANVNSSGGQGVLQLSSNINAHTYLSVVSKNQLNNQNGAFLFLKYTSSLPQQEISSIRFRFNELFTTAANGRIRMDVRLEGSGGLDHSEVELLPSAGPSEITIPVSGSAVGGLQTIYVYFGRGPAGGSEIVSQQRVSIDDITATQAR